MADNSQQLIAYETLEPNGMRIVPAPVDRDWMEHTYQQSAYHCLPMLIANQSGWVIENPVDFSVFWTGGPSRGDVQIEFGDVESVHGQNAFTFSYMGSANPAAFDHRISSHFGSGILTFVISYLFRTPAGVNLWVKGPSNWVKDGICPLEGIVETDWSAAPFTMNWKLTRPGMKVYFKKGDPICMIVPVSRGLAEGLQARQMPLANNPELQALVDAGTKSRNEFLRAWAEEKPEVRERGWEKHYFQGRTIEGQRFEAHQTQVRLKEFVRESS